MNLAELRDFCRQRTGDVQEPYLWGSPEWNAWLNEAEREACIRARLIEDWDSVVITAAAGESRFALPDYVLDVERVELPDGRELKHFEATRTSLILPRPLREPVTLTCHVIRLPKQDMVDDTDEPEIPARWHQRMTDWAIRCAHLKQDSETFDQQAADRYEARFTASFGMAHSANVQRKHRRNSPRVTRPIKF